MKHCRTRRTPPVDLRPCQPLLYEGTLACPEGLGAELPGLQMAEGLQQDPERDSDEGCLPGGLPSLGVVRFRVDKVAGHHLGDRYVDVKLDRAFQIDLRLVGQMLPNDLFIPCLALG